MSDVNKLSVKITGDESGLKKATQEAKRDISSVNSAALSFNKTVAGTALGMVAGNIIVAAFRKIADVVRQGKDEFEEASASMTKLATVMRQRGATQKQYDEIVKLTDAEQQLGVVSASAMRNGLQELATYVAKAESLKKLTNSMNNLAVQQHGYNVTADQMLQTATMMGKVLQGQTGGMERLGYHLDDNEKALFNYGTEEERVALLTQIVNDNLGNMNRALGQTNVGKQKQLANTWSDLRAQIGELANAVGQILIPVFSTIANTVGKAIAYIKAFLKLFGIQFTNAAAGNAGAVGEATDAIGDYGDAAAGAAKKAKKALAAFDEMNVLTEQTSSGGGSGGGGAVDLLGDIEASASAIKWDSLIPDIELPKWVKELKNLFKDIDIDKITKAFQKFGQKAAKFIDPLLQILKDVWNNYLVPMITWAGNDLLPGFLNAVGGALEFLGAIIGRLWDSFLKPFIDNFLVPIAQFTGGIIVGVLNAIGDALSWMAQQESVVGFITNMAIAIGVLEAAIFGVNAVITILNGLFGALGLESVALKGVMLETAAGAAGVSAGVSAVSVASGIATGAVNLLTGALNFLTSTAGVVGLALGVVMTVVEGVKLANDLAEMSTRNYTTSQQELERSTARAAQAAQDQQTAITGVKDAELAANDAELRLLELTKTATEKRQAYEKLLNSGTASQEELTRAELEAEIAEGRLEAQMRALEDKIKDAASAQDSYRDAVMREINESLKAEMRQKAMSGNYQEIVDSLMTLANETREYTLQSGEQWELTAEDAKALAADVLKSLDDQKTGFSSWLDKAEETNNNIRGVFRRMRDEAWHVWDNMEEPGDNFSLGVARGILRSKYVVQNAAKELAASGRDAFNMVLVIKSPSRVMAESGGYFVEGVEKGLQKETPKLERMTSNIGTAMVDAFNTAPKFRDLGSIDIADQFGELTARAQGTLELQNEATNGAIDQLAQAITNLADKDQSITVKIGEETLIDKVVEGINNASMMRNQTVINL